MNSEIDKMEEECGVFGVYTKSEATVIHHMFYGLFALQHRGQESAGVSISKDGKLKTHKAMGLVSHVLDDKTRLDTICGFAGVYSGRIQGKSALDAQLGIVWKKEVIEEIIEGKVLDSITF